MSFNLLVNILLSDKDCQALQKEPFRNTWAKTENPLLPGVTKLISMLFFGDINWAKLLVLSK